MSNLIGSTQAAFALTLSTALTEQVDIGWQTIDGTGKAGIDYEAASGTVSFAPGETAKQIQVLVYGQNSTTANGLTFHIKLTPPINAVLTNTLVDCTIVVTDVNNVPVTSLVVAQGKRGLAGLPGMSAYDHAVQMGYTGTLEQWMSEIADASLAATRAQTAETNAGVYAGRAEAAATASIFTGKVYQTAASGLDPVLGVPNGAYYFVRSVSSDSVIDEYRNLNGVATATGKSYPSYAALNTAIINAEIATDAANLSGKVYATAAAGVAPVTGVPVGDYFNVRSAVNTNYIDEYQNVGGVAAPTGKSYPSTLGVDAIASRVTVTENDIAGHEARLDTAETNIVGLDTRLDTAETNIGTLSTGLATANNDIAALDTRTDATEADIGTLFLSLPIYDPALTYQAGNIVNKDNQIQQYDGATWVPLLDAKANVSLFSGVNGETGHRYINGTMIQWGEFTGSTTADVAVTFPYAFPSGCYIVIPVPSSGSPAFANVSARSATGFTAAVWNDTGARSGASCKYIAIGS